MSNVGFATLQIVPSMRGIGAAISKEMGGPLEDAARRHGDAVSRSLTSKMTSAGKAMTAALTLPIAAFAAGGVKAFVDVDTKLREVNTLFGLTGAAGEKNFTELQGMVRGLSTEIGVAQSTLTQGLYNAISAGVPKENAFTFMQVASKAAIAGVTDVNTAVDGMTTVINAFGLESADAERVADSMFTAVKGGKTTFQELSDALFNVAPAAAASKVSMEEVNAAIATLTASGTPTSVATTQLRAALTGLQRPSTEMNAIFQRLGFTNAQTAIESDGLTFALNAVRDAAEGDAGKLQTLLGSVEAVAAANVLAGTGAAKMAQELENQGQKAGATETAFAEMEKSSGRRFERLKVNFQNLSITVGEALLPAVEKLTGGVQGLMDWFNRLSPAGQKLVMVAGGIVAALGPVLIISAKLIRAGREVGTVMVKAGRGLGLLKNADGARGGLAKLGPALKTAVTGLADFTKATAKAVAAGARSAAAFAAQSARTVAAFLATKVAAIASAAAVAASWLLAAAPFILIGAAIAALVVIVVKNWDTIAEFFAALPGRILGFFSAAGSWLLEAGKAIIRGLLTGIKAYFELVKLFYVELPRKVIGFFASAISWLIEAGRNILRGLWNGIKEVWQSVWDWFKGLGAKIGEFFASSGRWLFNAGKAIMRGLLDGIKDGFRAVSDFVGGLGGWFKRNKGPLDYDRRLLLPAGKAIMQGLRKGIVSQMPALASDLRRVTGQIEGLAASPTAAALTPKRLTPTAAALPSASGTSGGVGGVTVVLPNYLGDKREVARIMRAELLKAKGHQPLGI